MKKKIEVTGVNAMKKSVELGHPWDGWKNVSLAVTKVMVFGPSPMSPAIFPFIRMFREYLFYEKKKKEYMLPKIGKFFAAQAAISIFSEHPEVPKALISPSNNSF